MAPARRLVHSGASDHPELTMKIAEALALLQAVRQAQVELSPAGATPVKFAHMLARNARHLQAEIDLFTETVNAGSDMDLLRRHETRRLALLAEHADKDASGYSIVVAGQYQFKRPDQAVAKIDKMLAREFPGAAAMLTARLARQESLQAEEAERITVFRLPLAAWPDISPLLMDGLFVLVDEA